MDNSLEYELDKLLINNDNSRKIIDEPGDSNWGQLIIPNKREKLTDYPRALKMLLVTSYKTGILLAKTILQIHNTYPEKLQIVGLITDDPVSDDAKISRRRRIWREYNESQWLEIEDDILELALNAGVPCFTGAVKTNFARKLIKRWNPDAIQVCVFGQVIDKPIIDYPDYGIYNYHPADLAHHVGAGPQPYQDLVNRGATTSKFTIHHLTEILDAGSVVGQSPDINVAMADGKLPENLLVIEDRLFLVADFMAVILTWKLITAKENDLQKPIDIIDFVSYFSIKQKETILLPISKTTPDQNIRDLSDDTKLLIKKLLKNENSV